MESETGKAIYAAPVVAKAGLPDPTRAAPSKQYPISATLGPRNVFTGWWAMLQRYGMLKTKHSRIIGGQGIPGNCSETLRDQVQGLEWKILTADGEENEETEYYTLLLNNARDENGAIIGAGGLFDLVAQDTLNALEGGCGEVVRIRDGQYDGVPIGLYAIDGATMQWRPRSPDDEEPIVQVSPDLQTEVVRFRQDEVMHCIWGRYTQRGLQWYNRHPIQIAWVAINCLAAGDDKNYSLLTDVVPQGILNLGSGFGHEKAMEWRDAWRAARQGGKLEDIGLLWGTDKIDFVRFNEVLKEQPFQHMSYWYLTIVTGAHGMSPLDIGFMTQLNTKAGAEVSAELSKNKGLAHLSQVIKKAVEYWILSEGLKLVWPDIDPTDEAVRAKVRETNAKAISTAYDQGMGWLSEEEARAEAKRLEVFALEVEEPAPKKEPAASAGAEGEKGEEEQEEQGEVTASLGYVHKSHVPEVVEMLCPLCQVTGPVDRYPDHQGLCVCQSCRCTFDPSIEGGQL